MASTCLTCVAEGIVPGKVTFHDAAEYDIHQETEHGAPKKEVEQPAGAAGAGSTVPTGPRRRSLDLPSPRRAPRSARMKRKAEKAEKELSKLKDKEK